MKMSDVSPKSKAIAVVFCSKNDQIWNWLILIADWKVMKMSDVSPKSKAIALVFCSKMTKFEIDWFWLPIEKWWKWAMFGQKVRL